MQDAVVDDVDFPSLFGHEETPGSVARMRDAGGRLDLLLHDQFQPHPGKTRRLGIVDGVDRAAEPVERTMVGVGGRRFGHCKGERAREDGVVGDRVGRGAQDLERMAGAGVDVERVRPAPDQRQRRAAALAIDGVIGFRRGGGDFKISRPQGQAERNHEDQGNRKAAQCQFA